MKTEYIYINKPNYISVHYFKNINKCDICQWKEIDDEYLKNRGCIGVWHIKYKKLDCNFS